MSDTHFAVECLILKALKHTRTSEVSRDHGELGACELVLEEPVAQVDGQVDLVRLLNVGGRVLPLLHEDSHELVADLGRVLRVVREAELLLELPVLPLGLLLWLDPLRLKLLAPPKLVQALPEKDGIREHHLVEGLINSLRDTLQVESEYLIDVHDEAVTIGEVLIVAAEARLGALLLAVLDMVGVGL